MIALRDIVPGEEIFVDYGKWYWASLKPMRLTNSELNELKDLHCNHVPSNNVYVHGNGVIGGEVVSSVIVGNNAAIIPQSGDESAVCSNKC